MMIVYYEMIVVGWMVWSVSPMSLSTRLQFPVSLFFASLVIFPTHWYLLRNF